MVNKTLVLFEIARYAGKNAGLLPQPQELANLIASEEWVAKEHLARLRTEGFFLATPRGVETFHTKAAAMHWEEAACILTVRALVDEYNRPWLTEEEITAAIWRRYKSASRQPIRKRSTQKKKTGKKKVNNRWAPWQIPALLSALVVMGYLTQDNGAYGCTPKIEAHLPYLKLLLQVRPSHTSTMSRRRIK